jgi:hypothetical protein
MCWIASVSHYAESLTLPVTTRLVVILNEGINEVVQCIKMKDERGQ